MELRAFTGKKGYIDEVGSTREWTHAIGEGDEGFNFLKTQVTNRLHQTLSVSPSQVLAKEASTQLIELPELDDSERMIPESRQGTRL